MSTVVQDLFPGPYALPASAFAAPAVMAGAHFPLPVLRFDASTDESVYLFWRAHNYGSGDLSIDLEWYAESETTGDVVWEAAVAAVTPNLDAVDIEAKSFGAAATATDTHLGTTAKRLHRVTIALPESDLDALVAGDWCVLRIARDANAAGDTLAADALLARVLIHYSDI